MSKINPNVKSKPKMETDVRLAGGAGQRAAVQSNIALLRRVVLANLLWEDNAYVDGETIAEAIKRLIPLAALAEEARLVQKLRHTPLFIASEMCKYDETKPYVVELLPRIITRADMLTDFLAIYWKGGKTAIASTARKENLMNVVRYLDIAGLFDLIYSAKDVKRGKPSPEIYIKTMATLGVRPEETLIFEDSEVGIEAAKASGGHYLVVTPEDFNR